MNTSLEGKPIHLYLASDCHFVRLSVAIIITHIEQQHGEKQKNRNTQKKISRRFRQANVINTRSSKTEIEPISHRELKQIYNGIGLRTFFYSVILRFVSRDKTTMVDDPEINIESEQFRSTQTIFVCYLCVLSGDRFSYIISVWIQIVNGDITAPRNNQKILIKK